MADQPRYERRQVVSNLRQAFGGIFRTYLGSINEMGFRGAEGQRMVTEAVRQALGETGCPKTLKCEACGCLLPEDRTRTCDTKCAEEAGKKG